MQLRSSASELQESAQQVFMRESLDQDVKIGMMDTFREIDPLARQVLSDEGFLEFLTTFFNREHTKLEAARRGDPREGHPFEGERTEPLCTCDDRFCAYKEGRIPRSIREAEDPHEAIRSQLHTHNGHPVVLDDAAERFRETLARVNRTHRKLIIAGQYNTHPDEIAGVGVGDSEHAESESESEPAPADD